MGVSSFSNYPLPPVTSTVALTADNTAVATANVGLVLLSSDSATATARTFTLTASAVVGQEVAVLFTAGSSYSAQLIDTGIQKLRGDWKPLQYDMIRLVSDGTNWIELSRSNMQKAKTSTVALAADNQAVATAGVDVLLLTSDDTTAANRTFTLTASAVIGHRLLVVFTSGTSNTCQLADTGIQKLSAAWEPVEFGTLDLVSDGTNWIEVARAAN